MFPCLSHSPRRAPHAVFPLCSATFFCGRCHTIQTAFGRSDAGVGARRLHSTAWYTSPMYRVSASHRLRHSALAICLSLLAVMFAVEAKLALYSPASSPESEIRAAKAWPGQTATIITQGLSVSNSNHIQIPFVLLAVASMAFLVLSNRTARWRPAQTARVVDAALFFSPHSFVRPPPSR